jgi:hypothetical protein
MEVDPGAYDRADREARTPEAPERAGSEIPTESVVARADLGRKGHQLRVEFDTEAKRATQER